MLLKPHSGFSEKKFFAYLKQCCNTTTWPLHIVGWKQIALCCSEKEPPEISLNYPRILYCHKQCSYILTQHSLALTDIFKFLKAFEVCIHSQYHRLARVGRDLKDCKSPTPPATGRATNLHIQYQPRLSRAPSNLALNTSRHRASTASLGSCSSTSPLSQ